MQETQYKAYKFRFYPTPEQEALLLRTFGCVRLVYNKALDVRQKQWSEHNIPVSYADTSRMLTQWKKDPTLSFLNEVSSVPLQQAIRHLQNAYTGFFNKTSGYPKFKSRKGKQSATFMPTAFTLKGRALKLAKMREPLDVRWSRELPQGQPSSVVVSLDKAGRWHVVLKMEEAIDHLPESDSHVGIDLGLRDFAVTSGGEKFSAPSISAKEKARIRRAEKELARRQKGSRNSEKSRRKLARVHAKIADRRRDFNHKLSTRLIRENQVITVESLNVKGMMSQGGASKRGLNRAIGHASWAEFVSMLEYKSRWYGRTLVKLDQWYPSTQICSTCGAQTGPRGDLSVRSWQCSHCLAQHNRDVNAAVNILAAGHAVLACGDGRRLRHMPKRLSLKQESPGFSRGE